MKTLIHLAYVGFAVAALTSCGDLGVLDPNSKTINWRIMNCFETGMNFCGNKVPQNPGATEETCGDAKATAITFTVTSEATGGATKTSMASCPSASVNGTALIKLPDSTGPFNLHATLDGVSGSGAIRGCHLTATELEGFTLRIAYAGCGDTKCKTCN